jgi:hypothetical protein
LNFLQGILLKTTLSAVKTRRMLPEGLVRVRKIGADGFG